MGVIAISYSCIAPIILGFAGIGLYVVYLAYRYNLFYVYDSEIDTRGLLYPHALKQILTGVYLAEICLIGLFGLRAAFGPVLLMLMLIIFTGLVHVSLNEALGPLLYNLPRTLAVEEQGRKLPGGGMNVKDDMGVEDLEKLYSPPNIQTVEGQQPGDGMQDEQDMGVEDLDESESDSDTDSPVHGEQNTRAIEGASGSMNFISRFLKSHLKSKINTHINNLIDPFDFWTPWIFPDPEIKPNFLLKWLHPEIFADYKILRELVPEDLPEPIYPNDLARNAYYPPSMMLPSPKLWIPRDEAGVSRQEVTHTGKVIAVTDEGCYLDESNRVAVDFGVASPVLIDRIRY
jgi:hypothetical protein